MKVISFFLWCVLSFQATLGFQSCGCLKNTVKCHFIDQRSNSFLFSSSLLRPKRIENGITSDSKYSFHHELSDSLRLGDNERLQKVLSRAGFASRREAEKLILDGRVFVNGKMVTELGSKVSPRRDNIVVDGKKVFLKDPQDIHWVVVNKPRSIITTTSDDKGRDSVLSLVPKAVEMKLLPVGRLERHTCGLLLLTNDNGWIHPLTHASFEIKKRYEVVVSSYPTAQALDHIKRGIKLAPLAPRNSYAPSHLQGDTRYHSFLADNYQRQHQLHHHRYKQDSLEENAVTVAKVCRVEVMDWDRKAGVTLLDITVEEKVPQQIQRILEAINCPCVSMKRIEFGTVLLKGLRKGQWRELSGSEIMRLKDLVT